jgi:hypothetical protein
MSRTRQLTRGWSRPLTSAGVNRSPVGSTGWLVVSVHRKSEASHVEDEAGCRIAEDFR